MAKFAVIENTFVMEKTNLTAVVAKSARPLRAIPLLLCGLLFVGAGCTANQTQISPSVSVDTSSAEIGGAIPVSDYPASPSPTTTQPVTPIAATPACKHSPEFKFTLTEAARLKEIMGYAVDGTITPDLHQEFWSIMHRYGVMCDEDLKLTKDGMAAGAVCNKLFWQDALESVRNGQAYKSPERTDCENQTIRALLSPDKAEARIRANQDYMTKISTGAPIDTRNGDVVFTEETIQATLDGANASLERLNQLYTR